MQRPERAAAPGEPEAGELTGQVEIDGSTTEAGIVEGEIVEYAAELDVIAGQVRSAQERFVTARTVAVEAYFEIGHCLERARV